MGRLLGCELRRNAAWQRRDLHCARIPGGARTRCTGERNRRVQPARQSCRRAALGGDGAAPRGAYTWQGVQVLRPHQQVLCPLCTLSQQIRREWAWIPQRSTPCARNSSRVLCRMPFSVDPCMPTLCGSGATVARLDTAPVLEVWVAPAGRWCSCHPRHSRARRPRCRCR